MTRRKLLLAGSAASCASLLGSFPTRRSGAAPAASATPGDEGDVLRLGGERHLFIDDAWLSETSNVTFDVHPPRVRQIAVTPQHPWENFGEYSSVIDDGTGEYRMYYLCTTPRHAFTCLATSRDGVTWEKPMLGLHDFNGSKQNNIVIWGTGSGSAYYDEHDPDPRRRYKYFTCQFHNAGDPPTALGLVMYNSPDGIHFTKHEQTLLDYRADSQAVLFFDRYAGKYVCYIRSSDERGRTMARGQTDDPMKPWPYRPAADLVDGSAAPDPRPRVPHVLTSDELDPPETDLYGGQVFLYPWAHRVYLAFPTVYFKYKTDDRLHLSPDGKGGNQGVGEVQLAVSRDGIRWKRYRRPAYVKFGWHRQSFSAWPWMLRGMFRRPDGRIYQYVSLRRSAHGGREIIESPKREFEGFSLFEQQPDRFVSAEFAYTGGSATTGPLTFKGNRLTLNLDTGATGEARVAILDPQGRPHPDFSIEDSDLINCDLYEKTVTWRRGQGDVSSLQGKPVRLRFEMRGTRLYAMQFVGA